MAGYGSTKYGTLYYKGQSLQAPLSGNENRPVVRYRGSRKVLASVSYPKRIVENILVNTFNGGESLVVTREIPKTEFAWKSVNIK